MLVMISSISVPTCICNCFHAGRANSGKIRTFQGVPVFDALVRGEPPHTGARNFVTKNWRSWGSLREDCVILVCTVLIGLKGVTDRQTDRQTVNTLTMEKMREALHAVSQNVI